MKNVPRFLEHGYSDVAVEIWVWKIIIYETTVYYIFKKTVKLR